MRSYDHLKSLDIIYDKRGMGFSHRPMQKSVKKMYKKEFMGLEMLSIAKKINLLEISLDDFVESLKDVLEEQQK